MKSSTTPPSSPRAFCILLAAGGTGGHIYPAIALGQALTEFARENNQDLELQYCCGCRPGEIEIYRSEGIEPIMLPLSGRRRGVLNTAKFVREFFGAWAQISNFVRKSPPDLAVGFGNYISVPALVASLRCGSKIALHEQNAYPGLANRWFAKRAVALFTGLPVNDPKFDSKKTHFVGNPIRRGFLGGVSQSQARRELGLPETGKLGVCFGGSLGAAGVNQLLMEALPKAIENLDRNRDTSPATETWHFLWGTGRPHETNCRHLFDDKPGLKSRITLKPYIERMDLALAAADLVVARAGAMTLAELTAVGKPSILVPLPHSAGDHQRGNARAMRESRASIVVEETDDDAAKQLAESIVYLANDAGKRTEMAEAARKLAKPDAARKMAGMIFSILRSD